MAKSKVIIFALFFIIISLAFYWKIFLKPTDIVAGADNIYSSSAFYYLNHESFKENKELILWNPYAYSGYPFITSIIGGRFFPINLFLLFSYKDFYLNYYYPIFIFIAGFFTFLFLRKLKLGYFGSFIGGFIFMLNGNLVQRSLAGDPAHVIAHSLIPVIFYLTEIFFERKNIISASLVTLALAAQFLSGQVQFFFYTCLFLLGYYAFRTISDIRNLKKYLGYGSLILIFVLLISAIQLLPLLQFGKYITNRGLDSDFNYITQGSLPPYHIINLIMPYFFGVRLLNTYWGFPHAELYFYLGIGALILSFLAIISTRDGKVRFFWITAVITLILAMGRYTPLFKIINFIFPVLGFFQVPSRFLIIFTFCIAVLAGFGADFISKWKISAGKYKFVNALLLVVSLLSLLVLIGTVVGESLIKSKGEEILKDYYYVRYKDTETVKAHTFDYFLGKLDSAYNSIVFSLASFFILTSAFSILIYLFVKGKIRKEILYIFLIMFIAIELFSFNSVVADREVMENKFFPDEAKRNTLFDETEVITFLKNDDDLFRVHQGDEWIVPYYLAARHNIYLTTGYDTLNLNYYDEFFRSINNYSENYSSKLLGVLNVKYILSSTEINNNNFIFEKKINDTYIYRNKEYLPRFYFVYNNKFVNSNTIEYMKTNAFDPRNGVILMDQVNFSNGRNSSYKIEVLEVLPNRVKLNVNTENLGFLVYSDSWYPGWNAYDDGKKTEVYRVNYIQKGVFLESGEHEVEFVFKPKLFDIGKYLCLIGLILIFMIIIISIRKRA